MASSEDGQVAPAVEARVDKYYGDKELSDVVLQVENTNFHVHKMFLGVKSAYFKQLFFAKGSEEKNSFIIDANSDEFDYLIGAAYSHLNSCEFSLCRGYNLGNLVNTHKKWIDDWFKFLTRLMDAAEKFGVGADMRISLDGQFMARNCRKVDCVHCTMRGLFALHHNLPNAKKQIELNPKCVSFYLKRIGDLTNTYKIPSSDLAKFIEKNSTARETKAPAEATSADGNDEEMGPVVVEFGDPSLSDVTLIMGIYEFKLHKMCLANRSSYFRAMFFSEFKEKNEDRVHIEANGEAFKLLMELLYEDAFKESGFLECRPEETLQSAWERIKKFWQVMPGIMETLNFFDFPHQTVEPTLGFHYCGKDSCVECGNKKLLALMYNLAILKKKVTSTAETIVRCLKNFPECLPSQLSFSPKDLAELIDSLDKK